MWHVFNGLGTWMMWCPQCIEKFSLLYSGNLNFVRGYPNSRSGGFENWMIAYWYG